MSPDQSKEESARFSIESAPSKQDLLKKRQKSQFWTGILVAAGLALLTATYLVWGYSRFANRKLKETKQFDLATQELAKQEQEFRDGNFEMERLFDAAKQLTVQATLRESFENAAPKLFFFSPAPESRGAVDSSFLYSPDDDQTLVIQIEVSNETGRGGIRIFQSQGNVDSKLLQIPLIAGKLHHVEYGNSNNQFFLRMDDKELYATELKGNMGSQTGFTAGLSTKGLIQPGLLNAHYLDFKKPAKSGTWLNVSQVTLSRQARGAKMRRVVGVRMTVKTKGKMYVPETFYQHAKKDLKLKWDSQLHCYEVMQ